MNKDCLDLYKRAVAEGTVLLENRNRTLPLKENTHVAVFGRTQFEYYQCGTGSGRGTADKERQDICAALTRAGLTVDSALADLYKAFIAENPFDDGGGVWAGEPWSQKEMPLEEETVKSAAERNEVAIMLIGRSAGEDRDNADESGSYRLTETEEDLLEKISAHFGRVIVALNTGNLLDLSFLDRYRIDALLYLWQGGMCGAEAFAEVVAGKLYPSGKLTDTQAFAIGDYPSNDNFYDEYSIPYVEDIYVGYRYFETFAEDKVRYPFGYGLTYTDFDIRYRAFADSENITVEATVKNIGDTVGKQVIQIYFGAPCGKLGTPARQLIAFAKTEALKPQESTVLTLSFPIRAMASYDDSGVSGHKSCYILQDGDYTVFAGTDVRRAEPVFTHSIAETVVVEQLSEALAPAKPFQRFEAHGIDRALRLNDVPLATVDLEQRIAENAPTEILPTGDCGIKLSDVYAGKATLEAFIAQLSDRELAQLVCAEGIFSPKSSPGAAGSIGGLTEEIDRYNIPVCSVADGPSGIRVGEGKEVSLIPCGTLLAATWNEELMQEIYEHIGQELVKYEIDALLGPGVNIHRHPLCGRNFEYYSEDPYLSGRMAIAVTKGIAKTDSYSTVKHFCCNNREKKRSFYDVSVSERALREIYLKPFEMAVKEGKNTLIMTAYNKVNGFYTASSYDLTAHILRKEWHFDGFVMTDWWAFCNAERFAGGSKSHVDAMVRAQNDVYTVWSDSRVKAEGILTGLENGFITRAHVQQAAMNLCRFILRSHTFKRYLNAGCEPLHPLSMSLEKYSDVYTVENPTDGTTYNVDIKSGKSTVLAFHLTCEADALSQLELKVKLDNVTFQIGVNGTGEKEIEIIRATESEWVNPHTLTLNFPEPIHLKNIIIKQ